MPIEWWLWPIIMFLLTFVIGIFAVLGGVGGGVIFVPVVSGFFALHLDFVRSTGLLCALASALFAGPRLLKKRMVSLRLAMPLALMVSVFAVLGAYIGLGMPPHIVQLLLGLVVLFITFFMLIKKTDDAGGPVKSCRLSQALGICGIYYDESLDQEVEWRVCRCWQSLILFAFIGMIGGIFGVGAGWANVPILNVMLGLPVKMAAATSGFIVSAGSTAAVWVYFGKGAVLPLIAVPSVLGMALGAWLGARIMGKTRPGVIRYIVLIILFLAGIRALWKGISLWTQA